MSRAETPPKRGHRDLTKGPYAIHPQSERHQQYPSELATSHKGRLFKPLVIVFNNANFTPRNTTAATHVHQHQ